MSHVWRTVRLVSKSKRCVRSETITVKEDGNSAGRTFPLLCLSEVGV
eukprot:COSAG02_NODE_1243_length_13681_cov_55.123767_6_plen_47_part_00